MIALKLRIGEEVGLRDALGVVAVLRVINIHGGRVQLAFDAPGVVVERKGRTPAYAPTRGAPGAPKATVESLDAIIFAWHAALPDDARAVDDEGFRESMPYLRDLVERAQKKGAMP